MACQIENMPTFGNWNLPLQIQRRGNFFSDEGFEDSSRRHFESSAKDLLKEFDVCRNEDVFGSYRRLRDRQLLFTDKAVEIAEEEDKYKIVMDVEGFSDSDLTVKASGANTLEVEGRQEIRDGGAFSSRSFRRRFSLPGLALIEDATSVRSSDNVLTVSIPKKITEIKNESETSSNLSTSANNKIQSADFQKTENSFRSKNLEKRSQENIQKVKESSLMADKNSSLLERKDANDLFDVQIIPRQSFFDDSYFENVRQSFQKSVDEMMAKMEEKITSAGDLGIFRRIRDTKEENVQAVSVTEDDKEYKIVIDVHGFSEGDLKVRAVSSCELKVEGCVEKKTECTNCSHTFKRSFTLPSSVDIYKANSALSSEGILTIFVPKKMEPIDFAIPIRSEVATTTSDTSKSELLQRKINANAKLVECVLKKEHYVPVVQEEKINNKQSFEQQSKINENRDIKQSSTSSKTTHHLLDNLEKLVEVEKTKCEQLGKNEHIVPVNFEGSETKFSSKEIVQTAHSTRSNDFTQNSRNAINKDTEKLISGVTKLSNEISNQRNTGESKDNEYYVPVTVEASINFNTEQINKIKSTPNSKIDTPTSNKIQNKVVELVSHNGLEDDSTSNPSSRIIPIIFGGSMYSDSIFDDTRKSFEKEVQDVFSRFKKSAITKERNEAGKHKQAVQETSLIKNVQTTSTILDDAHSYKIVVDVFGFEKSELRIRTSGVNEILIKGISEKSKGGLITKNSFQRSFQLPEFLDLPNTSAALSSEGILTVTVPKTNQEMLRNDKVKTFKLERENEVTKSKDVESTQTIDMSRKVHDKRESVNIGRVTGAVKQREESVTGHTNTNATLNQREYVIPVSLEEAADTVSISDTTSNVGSTLRSTSVLTDMLSPDISQSDNMSTSTSQSSILSQSHNKSKAVGINREMKVDGITLGKSMVPYGSLAFADKTRDLMHRTTSLFNLPIVPKGHFFDDIFFQDSRSIFESALRNTMSRFSRSSSFIDDLGFFNSLRQKKLTGGGNHLATFSEDDQFNKIVLDVHGFNENNLKIKVISENEILIEGEVEEKSGNSISRKYIKKNFILPGLVNFRNSTTALSADGILNIKIPKNM